MSCVQQAPRGGPVLIMRPLQAPDTCFSLETAAAERCGEANLPFDLHSNVIKNKEPSYSRIAFSLDVMESV